MILWQAPLTETQQAMEFLAATDVPVVFVDLFQQPLTNGLSTIGLLGSTGGSRYRTSRAFRKIV